MLRFVFLFACLCYLSISVNHLLANMHFASVLNAIYLVSSWDDVIFRVELDSLGTDPFLTQPVTQLMCARSDILLGQMVVDGRVSYCHIIAQGDWLATDGFCCWPLMKCRESVGCAEEVLTVAWMGDGLCKVEKSTKEDISLHNTSMMPRIVWRECQALLCNFLRKLTFQFANSKTIFELIVQAVKVSILSTEQQPVCS